METIERSCWLALHRTLGEEAGRVGALLKEHYGRLADYWYGNDRVLIPGLTPLQGEKLLVGKKKWQPEQLWTDCATKGVEFIICGEADYPNELLQFSAYPCILYYYGRKSLLSQPGAAVVGSRLASGYGRQMARHYAGVLAAEGFCIVSGLAKGIDACAHEGALAAGGHTIAVLGCGPDVVYPPENRRLYEQVKSQGLLISEYYPGEGPLHWHFPRRNRIISGLSRLVLLVEAKAKSGALITCRFALEQGKDIWAIPGPVTNPGSIGPLQLIQDGAGLAITPLDILREYPDIFRAGGSAALSKTGDPPEGPVRRRDQGVGAKGSAVQGSLFEVATLRPPAVLSAEEKAMLAQVSYYPIHIDSLLADAPFPRATFYLVLTNLLRLRLIEKLPGDYYQRI